MLIPHTTIVDGKSIRLIPGKKQLNPGLISQPGLNGRAVVNRLRGLSAQARPTISSSVIFPYLESTRGYQGYLIGS